MHNFIIYNSLQIKPTGQINFEDVRTQMRIILEKILKTGCDVVGWINPAQNTVQWRAVVNHKMS
jgi:hypothetical protein